MVLEDKTKVVVFSVCVDNFHIARMNEWLNSSPQNSMEESVTPGACALSYHFDEFGMAVKGLIDASPKGGVNILVND